MYKAQPLNPNTKFIKKSCRIGKSAQWGQIEFFSFRVNLTLMRLELDLMTYCDVIS